MSLLKALLMHAAYTAAASEFEGNPSVPAPVDQLAKDAGLAVKNLAIYETAKVHYAALARAYEDKTGIWPDPKLTDVGGIGPGAITSAGAAAAALQAVAGGLAKAGIPAPAVGIVSAAISQALAALANPGGVPTQPVPAPGSDLGGAKP